MHLTLGRGGSRGRVQGVRTPPPWDDLRFSNTTGILPKKKKTMWFLGVEVEQETSVPPPKKNPGSAPVRSLLPTCLRNLCWIFWMYDLIHWCFFLQDYHWWWRSFFTSGSCSIYVFLYAVFYFVTKVSFSASKAQWILWFMEIVLCIGSCCFLD